MFRNPFHSDILDETSLLKKLLVQKEDQTVGSQTLKFIEHQTDESQTLIFNKNDEPVGDRNCHNVNCLMNSQTLKSIEDRTK